MSVERDFENERPFQKRPASTRAKRVFFVACVLVGMFTAAAFVVFVALLVRLFGAVA